MNPHETIKPWLLGCGRYFGANEAHEYRWADAKNRPEVKYFTYQIVSGMPTTANGQIRRDEKKGQYDLIDQASQHWTVVTVIDLYNDPEGFDHLAGCSIAAQSQAFVNLFTGKNAQYTKVLSLKDESETNDDRTYYRHRLICEFTTWQGYRHEQINEVVTTVVLDDPFGVS